MELFLIRHAESKNNVRKNDFERLPDPELTENGEIQSRYLAKFLQKGRHLSDEEFKINMKNVKGIEKNYNQIVFFVHDPKFEFSVVVTETAFPNLSTIE